MCRYRKGPKSRRHHHSASRSAKWEEELRELGGADLPDEQEMGDGGDQEGPVEGALKRFVMVVSLYRYTVVKMNTPGST